MNTEKQAQQLELAAAILRTGHPFEYHNGDNWFKPAHGNPLGPVSDQREIRIVLAAPPYPAKIHNPDSLTAEQVGVGWRLLLGEQEWRDYISYGGIQAWDSGLWVVGRPEVSFDHNRTYRTPLQNPWPEAPKPDPYAELKAAHAAGKVIQHINHGEWFDLTNPAFRGGPPEEYRIKPEPPPFQLPPPPPGMSWHRTDGWKHGDLPPGCRPHFYGEKDFPGDEVFTSDQWRKIQASLSDGSFEKNDLRRTTRPLTFTHAGKTWTWHRPGDLMPCDGGRQIEIVDLKGSVRDCKGGAYFPRSAFANMWRKTLGWRYADETIPLGPEDVPPGSVFKHHQWKEHSFRHPKEVNEYGVHWYGDGTQHGKAYCTHQFSLLREDGWLINRPRNRDADGNPTKWEPCHKPAP